LETQPAFRIILGLENAPPIRETAETKTTFIASNWKRIDRNTLIGTCDVETRSGFVFRGLMLHEKPGTDGTQKRWVQVPSREYKKEDGTRSFFPVIEFTSPDRWRAFNSACLAAIDTLLAAQGGDA
jgi:hypothetical protein